MQNHREVVTFEDFASQVFSPSPGYPLSGTGEKRTAAPVRLHFSRCVAGWERLRLPSSSAHLPPFLHFFHICPPPHPSLPTLVDEYQMRRARTFPPPVRLQTPPLPQSLRPAVVSVCSCFRAATFPVNIRRLFKWRCRACASTCAHAHPHELIRST